MKYAKYNKQTNEQPNYSVCKDETKRRRKTVHESKR